MLSKHLLISLSNKLIECRRINKFTTKLLFNALKKEKDLYYKQDFTK